MKPCSHISSHREWPTLEEPLGDKGEKKTQNKAGTYHNFKRQMILAGVGDIIFGLVLFLQDSYF